MLIPNKHSGYSVDGRRLYHLDMGGDGGGAAPAPTQEAVTATELPEWARGYAKDTLAKTAALTDINQNPYQAYSGNRIAGFSPLQLQSQQAAAGMQQNQATGQGIGLAGQAAQNALGTNYQGGNFYGGQFGNQQAANYMSPFIEQALQPQLREAQRSSDIMGQQQQAQAVGRGAFGGSRDALMRAERERNLGMQMGDIRAKGLQDAYSQAQAQFNADASRNLQAQQLGEQSRQYGAGLGLQGLQTALTGANTLGALGGQQFQQGMDINKLQNAYGGQQQALQQQGLTQAYNDFLEQKNYPYKQLGFMSDMIRGLPVGQTSTKSVYEAEPSTAQNLASLGTAAYGLSKFMAEGGMAYADGGDVEGYKSGGGVDSRENVEDIVRSMRGDTDALQRSYQAAKLRGDKDQMDAIESEMAIAASLRRGIAGGVTNDMAERMAADGGLMGSYAGGGVVAFASGGSSATLDELSKLAATDLTETPEQRDAGISAALPGVERRYGASATAPYLEEIKKERAGLSKMNEQGEGLAWLAASKAILRPGSKSRALSEAASAFGGELVKMKKEQRDADRLLRQSEITLATAEQARKDGQVGKAESLYEKSQSQKKEGLDRQLGVLEKKATIQAGKENAQTQAAATLGKATDLDKLTKANYEAMLEAGDPPNAATRAAAAKAAADQLGKYPGTARAEAATAKAMAPELESALLQSKEYRKAMNSGDYEKAATIRAQIVNSMKPAEQGKGGPAPAPQQSAAPVKVTSQAQFAKLAPGTTFIAPDGSTRVKP